LVAIGGPEIETASVVRLSLDPDRVVEDVVVDLDCYLSHATVNNQGGVIMLWVAFPTTQTCTGRGFELATHKLS